MRRLLGVAFVIPLTLSAVAVWAGELEGRIQSVDTSDRTIVLDDGTKLSVAEGVPIDMLREGTDVRVSYEERDGTNIVTSVEVK